MKNIFFSTQKKMTTYNVILAMTRNGGIGLRDTLPWRVPEELALFRQITLDSILIVGRKTALSLPLLPRRTVLVLSKQEGCFHSILDAVRHANTTYPGKKIFVAGGKSLYEECFQHPGDVSKVYISVMKQDYECDTFVKFFPGDWLVETEKDYTDFTHRILTFSSEGERNYLHLLKEISDTGSVRKGRNGETKSLFGKHLSFDLSKGFPLLTTKKMFLRGIIEELLFFIRGQTNSKILEEKGVNIWKGNTSRAFLDSLGMKDREEGDMGPLYGYQWRHFNAPYRTPSGEGLDQLRKVVEQIREDPYSRRILLTDFNPLQAEEGVLYPCHSIIIQFYVREGKLDMTCYNRSQDVFLGTPFNIASSALFLTLIARITTLEPGRLSMFLGDTHIYSSHYTLVEDQLNRFVYRFPELRITKEIKEIEDLEKLAFSDFFLGRYVCSPAIKAEMVA